MPYGSHECLALLVPSVWLLFAAFYLHIREEHAAFVRFATIRDSQKSEGGSYRE